MMIPTPFLPRWRFRSFLLSVAVCVNLLISFSAVAGNISFDLSLTGTVLTITHRGDYPAFYPVVFRMLSDGRWEALANTSPDPLVQLLPGAKLSALWPAQAAPENLPPVARLQPVMVRFFDQAGVGFGQISFFRPPPESDVLLKADFSRGKLAIEPPEGAAKRIHASWLLRPQEEGIGPIKKPVNFMHAQPPALRIDWRADANTQYVDVGAGQPATILLHETDQGLSIQHIPGGGLQGREQRPFWLNATAGLYGLSAALLLMAMAALIWPWIAAKQGTRKGTRA